MTSAQQMPSLLAKQVSPPTIGSRFPSSRKSASERRRPRRSACRASAGALDEGALLRRAAQPQPRDASQQHRSSRGTWHFLRHLGEMVLAMMVGMMALGALDRVMLAAAGSSVTAIRNSAPEVVALVMALNMAVGMTVWMRYRRHSWAMCAEMSGAMFLPAVAAIVLFWCTVIHGGSITTVAKTAMLPAMIAVMLLRRTEYSQPVHKHAQEAVAQIP
jgi:hypothetical protein